MDLLSSGRGVIRLPAAARARGARSRWGHGDGPQRPLYPVGPSSCNPSQDVGTVQSCRDELGPGHPMPTVGDGKT